MTIINWFLKLTFLLLASCTPMELLSQLKSPHLEQINFLKTIRDYQVRSLHLLHNHYHCITAIKQITSQQHPEKQLIPKHMTVNIEAFHELQLLEELSVKYWTTVFWYEYQHKRYVRQFDDEDTRIRNGKKALENIVMGKYDRVQDLQAMANADEELVQRTVKFRKAVVEDVGLLVAERDPHTNIVTINKPMFSGGNSRFYRFRVTCSVNKTDPLTNRTITSQNTYTTVPLSPYQLYFFRQAYNCGNTIDSVTRMDKTSSHNLKVAQLNLHSNLLYGNIEQVCNLDKPITPGYVLLLYIEEKKGNITVQKKEYLVVIEEVIGEDAYVVDSQVQGTKIVDECMRVSEKDFGLSGDVQFPTPRDSLMRVVRASFSGLTLMRFASEVEVGEQLFCYTIANFFHTNVVIPSRLVVGEKLGGVNEVYHFQVDGQNYSPYFQTENQFTCTASFKPPTPYLPKQPTFTRVQKLASGTKHPTSLNTIYALTLSKDCIIELTMQVPYAHIKYILTGRRMYRVEQLPNGTVLERAENTYYENSTENRIIYLYRGLWRMGDLLMFPRFVMEEEVASINVRFGYVYVRELYPEVLGYRGFVLSSSWMGEHLGYGPKKRPQKCISTEKRFKSGEFCSAPINRQRETVVSMRCGESWFRIDRVRQTSPCVYNLEISTQFLCPEKQRMPTLGNSIVPFNGTICYPL